MEKSKKLLILLNLIIILFVKTSFCIDETPSDQKLADKELTGKKRKRENQSPETHKRQKLDLEEKKECSVCFDKINAEDMYTLSCLHIFHKSCIYRWLLTNRTCPLDRKKISKEEIKELKKTITPEKIAEIKQVVTTQRQRTIQEGINQDEETARREQLTTDLVGLQTFLEQRITSQLLLLGGNSSEDSSQEEPQEELTGGDPARILVFPSDDIAPQAYPCRHCQQIFEDIDDLVFHVMTRHPVPAGMHRCPHCLTDFSEELFNLHITMYH